MKTERLPAVRVSRALRNAAAEVLEDGETISSMTFAAVAREIEMRRRERDFAVRGLVTTDRARRIGASNL